MTDSVISLKEVTAGYSRTHPALRKVSLEISRGEFIAVIGPNGGGKTTLLKVILGLIEPFSGEVRVFGTNPHRLEGARLGYVPQVIPDMTFPATVLDVVLMGLMGRKGTFRGFGRKEREQAFKTMNRLGISPLAGKRADQLSGGQKQRMLIARALVGEPEVLLLDEPLASVDTVTQDSFYDLLAELNASMTILMVTHDVGAVSSHVKSIACVNQVLVSHGETIDEQDVSRTWGCPFELITHGVPHRVLGERKEAGNG